MILYDEFYGKSSFFILPDYFVIFLEHSANKKLKKWVRTFKKIVNLKKN